MARSSVDLKAMDLDALLSLRERIDTHLHEKRRELESQISRISTSHGVVRVGRGGGGGARASVLKGAKVPPKFRGPEGETWAGRGAQPRWLTALLKQGHKLEDFAIDKVAASRTRGASKRSRGRKKA